MTKVSLACAIGLAAVGALGLLASPASAQKAADNQRHTIAEICAGGECVWEKYATCSGFIEGINVDKAGTVWMVGYLEGRILKVENGQCVTVGAQGGAPNGAKFAPDGRFFVADRLDGLQAVDTATGERKTVHSQYVTAQFRGLNDLVFDSMGGYYFTEPYGSDAVRKLGRVYYVAPGENSKPELFLDGIAFPNGVAITADDQRVYVSEYGANQILSAPAKNAKNIFETVAVFARLQGGIGPDGLAVDATGNVYAAHFGAGEIAVYDAQGFPYGIVRLPEGAGPFTTNLALHDGWLYVTEAIQNVVWRMKVNTRPIER